MKKLLTVLLAAAIAGGLLFIHFFEQHDARREAEAIAASEYPVLPMYYKANMMLMHNNIAGYWVTPSNDLLLKTAYVAE